MVVFTPGMLATGEIVHFADPAVEEAVRRRLDIPDTAQITSTDMLELDHLTLNLFCGDTTNLGGLEYAVNLRSLRMDHTRVADLSPLSRLVRLHSLHLWRNEISDVGPLSQLAQLRSLNLSDNSITDVSPLRGLTSLTSLNLRENSIPDISSLDRLISMEWLRIGCNDIRSISAIAHMPALQYVWAGDNLIDDVSPLQGLKILQIISLPDNLIEDISPLLTLAAEGRLYYLDLRGNPLNEEAYTTHLPFIEANNPDATILYDPVPEPLVLSTMLMGALMLLRRKKPHVAHNAKGKA